MTLSANHHRMIKHPSFHGQWCFEPSTRVYFQMGKTWTMRDSITLPLKFIQAYYNWMNKIRSSFRIHNMYW
jgi:hypothetical protein